MATGPGVYQGKTPFVEQFLTSNRDADLDAAIEAWQAAGNEGTISESLFGKARSKLGLTGKQGKHGGATEEAVDPAAKPKSSPKGAKGKAKPEVEEPAPPQPEAREGRTGPAKSAFVEEVLGRDPQANVKAVNLAWSQAGHDGSISDSIFYKAKRELGEAGVSQPGGTAAVVTPQPKESETASAPSVIGDVPQVVARPKTHAATAAGGVSAALSGVGRVVDEVESGIDELMFTLKANGGMPEVEAALRAARRLLVRSNEG